MYRRWSNCLDPCNLNRRSRTSARPMASACTSLSCCGHMGSEAAGGRSHCVSFLSLFQTLFFFSSKEILKQISMCGVLKVAMYLDRRKCYPIGSRGCRLILLGGRVGHPKHFILALGLLWGKDSWKAIDTKRILCPPKQEYILLP